MIEHNIKLFGPFKEFGFDSKVKLWDYVRQIYKAFQNDHKKIGCVLEFDGFLYMYANVLTPEDKQYKQLTAEQQHVLEMATKYWIGFSISKSLLDRKLFAKRSIPVVIDKETNEGFIEVSERKIISADVVSGGREVLKKVTPAGDIETFGGFFEPAAQRIVNPRNFKKTFDKVREKYISDAKDDGSYAEWEQCMENMRRVADTKTRMALLQAVSCLIDTLKTYKTLVINKTETRGHLIQLTQDLNELKRLSNDHNKNNVGLEGYEG